VKQFFKMFFASLLAVIVASVIVVGVSIGLIIGAVKSVKTARSTTRSPQEASILVLKTDQHFHEQGEDNSFAAFSGASSYSAGLHDVVEALREAKTDNNIKGVLLRLEGGANGWATMEQLRDALLDFKSSGKKI